MTELHRPKVSVLMIAYNQEAYIGEAIRSVVSQKAPFAFELIVADDASTDSTADVASAWADRYPGIVRLLRRPENLGLQANYLDAYAHARGEYIAICEADDWWCSRHKLARQARMLDQHPDCALCFHRVVNYYQTDGSMSLSNPHQSRKMELEDLARANGITNLSVMYRAIPYGELPQWLSSVRLFDYAMHSLHAERGSIGFLPQPMAVYRRHDRGIWSGDRRRGWLMAMDVRERLIGHFLDNRREAAENLADSYLEIAAALEADGDEEARGRVLTYLAERNIPVNEDDFAARVERRRGQSAAAQGLLSSVRRQVSRLLPVPRIYRGCSLNSR